MSKHESAPPLQPGDFQLDPAQFKTGNMFVDGAIKSVCEALNSADLDHDQRRDIAEYAPIAVKLFHAAKDLSGFIDVPGIVAWVKTHPEFFKAGMVEPALQKLETVASHVAEIAEIAPKS